MNTGLFACVWILCSLSAAADYVVVQRVDGGSQSGTMTIKIKDSKSRADLAPQVSTITDGETGEVITLMHAQKSYMKIPPAQTKALFEQMRKLQEGGQTRVPPKLTASGRKEKIGEYECEIYTWTGNGISLTYWLSKNHPNYAGIQSALGKMQNSGLSAVVKGMMPDAAELPGVAMKTEMSVGSQKVTTTLVSITEETIEPSVFEIPRDYKELPAPAFEFPSTLPAK